MICLSGGVDSALVAQEYPGHDLIFFDYGQPCLREEIKAARRVAEIVGAGLRCASLPSLIGKGESNIFHGRNTLFATVAASYSDCILFGFCLEDQGAYPDCSPEWLAACAHLLSTFYRPTILEAPFIGTSKAEILARLNPDLLAACYSCYEPFGPCGYCASCKVMEAAR